MIIEYQFTSLTEHPILSYLQSNFFEMIVYDVSYDAEIENVPFNF